MLENALSLAGMGLRVFPVRKKDKKPAITGWPELATTNEDQISSWWNGSDADRNIGIATGKDSGIFVLDVDVGGGKKGMESLAALEMEIGPIPRDRVVRTGAGGLHIYLKYPDDGKDIKNSVGMLGKDLDIRGTGGFVVAPSSIHPSGQRYAWEHTADADTSEVVETLDDFPECPALVKYIHSRSKIKERASGISTQPSDFLKEGGRNETLFSEARQLYLRGRKQAEVLSVIGAMNISLGSPSLPDGEIETLVASAANYVPSLPQDDDAYARDIAQRLADRFRQVGGEWYGWDGQRWAEAGEAAWKEAVKEVLRGHAATARKELDEGEKLARSLLSSRRIGDLARLASTDAVLQASPADLDVDANLLNLNNGILKLDSLELLPHDPALMLTKLCPAGYDPHAKPKCPTFDRFLREVQPDAEVRAFLARLFGYALLGNPAEHRFFIFHGPGRNGKSALMDAVMHVLGSYALTADPSTFIMRRGDVGGPRGDLVRLKDARLVNTSELGVGQILDAPLIKRLAGGENITASRKHKDEVEFRPVFVPFMTTNALPVIDGGDSALARRLVAVPFVHVVAEKDQDTRLSSKLKAEAEGILGWMLEGLRDYRARGLAVPDDIAAHTREWTQDTDLVQQFLDDCYERDPKGKIAPQALQSEHRFWCSQRGYAAMSESVLRQALERKGIPRPKIGGYRVYVGIKERPQSLRVAA